MNLKSYILCSFAVHDISSIPIVLEENDGYELDTAPVDSPMHL